MKSLLKKRYFSLVAVSFLLVVFISITGLFLYANMSLLPAAVQEAQQSAADRYGIDLHINKAGLAFPRSVRLSGLTLSPQKTIYGFTPSVFAAKTLIRINIWNFLFKRDDREWLGPILFDKVKISIGNEQTPLITAPVKRLNKPEVPQPVTSQSSPKAAPVPAPQDYSELFWENLSLLLQKKPLPQRIQVRSGAVDLHTSDGVVPLLNNFNMTLVSDLKESVVTVMLDGDAYARGTFNVEKRTAEGSFSVTDFDAAAFSQLVPRISESILSGTLNINTTFFLPSPGLAEFDGMAVLENMTLAHHTLGDDPVDGISGSYEFNFTCDSSAPVSSSRIIGRETPTNPGFIADSQENERAYIPAARGEIVFRKGVVKTGSMEFDFIPVVRGIFPENTALEPFSLSRLDVQIYLPDTQFKSIMDSLPEKILGPLKGLQMAGSVSWSLDIEIPMERLALMNWRSSTHIKEFSLSKIPSSMNISRLNREFFYYPDGAGDQYLPVPNVRPASINWMLANSELTERQIARLRNRAGSAAPVVVDSGDEPDFGDYRGGRPWPGFRYFYLEDMSPWIPKAVLTAEDGDFFFHNGINWFTFKNAVERNFSAGEVELGASTLTMQLIKNLFLSPDRALMRKIHEAVLVYLTEEAVPVSKDRLLELYLNLVEFGPGLYGVEQASQHYFGKSAGDIDPLEAVWLASVLPSPRRYYRYFEAGSVSDYWAAHLKTYLDLMLERGRMTEEEYASVKYLYPVFTPHS